MPVIVFMSASCDRPVGGNDAKRRSIGFDILTV